MTDKNTAAEMLTDASLVLSRLREGISDLGLEGADLLRCVDDVLAAHSAIREVLDGPEAVDSGGSAEVTMSRPSTEAETEHLRAQIVKMDERYRRALRQSELRQRDLVQGLNARVAAVEQRHHDLLHGTIFTTLRRLAKLARWMRPRHTAAPGDAIAPASGAGELKQPTKAPRAGALPPPATVAIAGVPYMCRPKTPLSAQDETYPGSPLISVVITSYNTGAYIEAAVRSVLDQTWSNLEVVIVDDCSTDDTRQVLQRLAADDPRVRAFCFGVNRGTYWSKNYGITRAKGEVVTFMDSDDISLPTRIAEQFALLNQPGVAVTTCNHVRKTVAGETIAINGVVERVAYISQMVKRAVFSEIGYFDTVRTSADDEFLRRIRRSYGREAEKNVKKALYVALLRDGSLTSDPENAINFVQAREGQAFLSPQRRHYAAMCERWHEFLEQKNLRPYMPFPVVRRPFPVFGRLRVEGERYDGNFISACMASYPARRERLKVVVDAVLPQVDHLYIYLNEYAEAEVPQFLRHSRITFRVGGENLRDNGKFQFMRDVRPGYVCTIDDDLEYPDDYVQTLIRKIEFYERRAVVGLHGTIYGKPLRSFFKGRVLLHFEEGVERDTVVNQLGTGTVAFHTSTIKPDSSWFKDSGMADVWFAVEAKKRGVPLISIERPEEWLIPQGVEETTLFREFRNNDRVQTRAIKAVEPWGEALTSPLAETVAQRSAEYGAPFSDFAPREGITPQEAEDICSRRAERYARKPTP